MELLAVGLAVVGLGLLLWGLWPRRSGARAAQRHSNQAAPTHVYIDINPVLAGTYVSPAFDPLASSSPTNDVLNVTNPSFSDSASAAPTSAETDSAPDSRLPDAACLPDPSDWGSNNSGSTDTASCDTGSSSSDSGSSDSGSTSSE